MFKSLHTNQRLFVEELVKRGAKVQMIDEFDELMQVSYKDKIDYIVDRFSSQVPFHMTKISADKHLAKSFMNKAGIPTPQGQAFSGNDIQEAIAYSKNLFPMVLKPNWGSHGDHIQVDLRNEQELETALWKFIATLGKNTAFILEKYHPWKEYRLFITKLGGFAVVHRQPASIVGDGKNTIDKLISWENEKRLDYKKNHPTSMCPIVLDDEVLRYLSLHAMSLDHIPNKDEQVFLRYQSNLAKGGLAIDMTDKVDSSIKELALKTLKAFPGLPCAGLDLLCEDITQPLKPANHVILEVNSSPGLAMHTYPTHGQSRNVASLLVDVMFPDLI